MILRLDFYKPEDLYKIVVRSAGLLEIPTRDDGALEIAKRARGTPRIANRLLRRVRDYAEVEADGVITRKVASRALDMLEVDEQGLDKMDRFIMHTIIEKFDGGPIGLSSLCAAVGEEKGTIEDVLPDSKRVYQAHPPGTGGHTPGLPSPQSENQGNCSAASEKALLKISTCMVGYRR